MVVSEEALVEVEALDILTIIEAFVEDRQITFKSLFMQYNRSPVRQSTYVLHSQIAMDCR